LNKLDGLVESGRRKAQDLLRYSDGPVPIHIEPAGDEQQHSEHRNHVRDRVVCPGDQANVLAGGMVIFAFAVILAMMLIEKRGVGARS